MSKENKARKGCKDVFNAFLVSDASYDGLFEIPSLSPTYDIPNQLIAFSRARSSEDFNQWVHFYEDDYTFEPLWRNPQKYLERLKCFKGVILPDFSLYRDMPFVMQLWNIYRSRAIGVWLERNGVRIIPNVRFGDPRTYSVCCNGISKRSVIAVGSHGTLRFVEDRKVFLEGLDYVVKQLKPTAIVVYGSAPEKYFDKYRESGIRIIVFASKFATSHKRQSAC